MTPNEGEIRMLEYILNYTTNDTQGNLVLQLYNNDVTPSASDTISTYIECSAGGYIELVLTGTSWVISINSGVAEGTYSQQTFNFLEAESIYGYMIKNLAKNRILFAEKFSSGVEALPSNGGIIRVTPKIRLRDLVNA